MVTTRFLLSSLQSRTIPTPVAISVWYCSICASSIHEREKYDPSGLCVAGSYPGGGGGKNQKQKNSSQTCFQLLINTNRPWCTFWRHWQVCECSTFMPDPAIIINTKRVWHILMTLALRGSYTLNARPWTIINIKRHWHILMTLATCESSPFMPDPESVFDI
jgi:hypothetical protein